MTLIDELKILDDNIKTNQAQCGFDREAAKISVYHLNNWTNMNL